MRLLVIMVVAVLGLGACVPVTLPTASGTAPGPGSAAGASQPTPAQRDAINNAAQSFVGVVARMEPVAQAMCRQMGLAQSCAFQFYVDGRPNQPPNAYQMLDRANRPVIAFTASLIVDAQNADELAFILGHEAAHHIAGHIPKRAQSAMASASLAGILAQAGGADEAAIRDAQNLGAEIGARTYSKDFELEADALGARIAYLAGYDPVRGSAYFDRLPDPGDRFLGTHPRNAQRKAVVRAMVAQMQAGG